MTTADLLDTLDRLMTEADNLVHLDREWTPDERARWSRIADETMLAVARWWGTTKTAPDTGTVFETEQVSDGATAST